MIQRVLTPNRHEPNNIFSRPQVRVYCSGYARLAYEQQGHNILFPTTIPHCGGRRQRWPSPFVWLLSRYQGQVLCITVLSRLHQVQGYGMCHFEIVLNHTPCCKWPEYKEADLPFF